MKLNGKKLLLTAGAVVIGFGILGSCLFGEDDPEEITSTTGITDFEFCVTIQDDSHMLDMEVGEKDKSYFTIEGTRDFILEDFSLISTNPEVATFTYDSTALTTYIYFEIEALSAGETRLYVETRDGTIKSPEILVTVSGEEKTAESEIIEETSAETTEEATAETVEETTEETTEETIVETTVETTQSVVETTTTTAVQTTTVAETTAKPTFSFTLTAGKYGDYGKDLVYNEGTEFPDASIAYYIPDGKYKIINVGDYMTQVNICSDKINIVDGWEEPASVTVQMLDVNTSFTVTIPDNYHIEIAEPTQLKLEMVE